jgi:hypothetical protein
MKLNKSKREMFPGCPGLVCRLEERAVSQAKLPLTSHFKYVVIPLVLGLFGMDFHW